MNVQDNGAMTEGGVWGGVAAAMGGAVRAIQNPKLDRRQFWTTTVTALAFGVVTGILVIYFYADRAPPHLAACAAFGVGLFVSELMKVMLRMVTRASDRLIDGVDARLDAAGWKACPQVKADTKSGVRSPSVPPTPFPPTVGDSHVGDPAAGRAKQP